ncbi:hypothetical protein ABZ639_23445 [Saccharomonospora sp. NPDC006951]
MQAVSLSRRSALLGALGGAGALVLGGTTASAHPLRGPHIAVATNEPWGTYHVEPLLAEFARRRWKLTQLVPDLEGVDPETEVDVSTPGRFRHPDLLVLTGAGEWPVSCALRFPLSPLAASSLAYLGPERAPLARTVRRRLRTVTSSSRAEAEAFGGYLGVGRGRVRVVGSPQTDSLPRRAPEPDLVLVVTSVTRSDTGGNAPGTELLLAAAERLAAAGKRILVGLHPREDRGLWERYEISEEPTVTASAKAEAAIGIPGTVFPIVTAVGTPVIGCVDPALKVPDYLLSVCSSTIEDPGEAVTAIESAALPGQRIITDAVGPVGGSAVRLLDAWERALFFRRKPFHDRQHVGSEQFA